MITRGDPRIDVVDGERLESVRPQLEAFLSTNHLKLDSGVNTFVVAYDHGDGRIVGCAGLDRNIVKCVGVDESFRGSGLSLKIGTEVVKFGLGDGYDDFFLYTKYENSRLFRGWGFSPIIEIPEQVSFMEFNPARLSSYLAKLSLEKKSGSRIGSVVMNANPFTNGHRYLVEQASKECDWVHVFLVKENASLIPYDDRLMLVRAGISDLPNVIVHAGSNYIISRATFPQYFLKNAAEINEQASAVDALLFRKYIAPTLDIDVRYVGTEPIDKTTAMYNRVLMKYLYTYPYDSRPIKLKEIKRLEYGDTIVSATAVRALLSKRNFDEIKKIVPETTLSFLRNFDTLREDRAA
ncbi:[citrate (pro-3S)-lyase] ligase [Acetobacter sacchari]|uniref:[Citrate [pro-3S]-lyase] ligase n=1 Tax=Acetobacter sacchari TaxID=2661687 RepID=A0ABS3M0I1_9PROT|nr:[citrate (pro-3S)-lyase] ligase [Acetobacter sacchari]MBO1361674.1 [citrate (pro-3S)-lyase] ligase [Acetobacter sacchari]